MKVPVMKEFIFGLSIRTGAIVIASMGIICSLMMAIPVTISAIGSSIYEESRMQPENSLITKVADREVDSVTKGAVICLILGIALFQFLISGLLLLGIKKGNTCMMWPWMILSIIGIAIVTLFVGFLIIATLYLIFTIYANPFLEQLLILYKCFEGLLTGFGSLVVAYYFLSIVYLQYSNMKSNYSQVDKMSLTP